MRDLVGIQFFPFGERTGRTAADFSDERAKMFADDDLAQFFMA